MSNDVSRPMVRSDGKIPAAVQGHTDTPKANVETGPSPATAPQVNQSKGVFYPDRDQSIRRSGTESNLARQFMDVELPQAIADARQKGYGSAMLTLSTPIRGFGSILKAYFVKTLNADDRAKLQALSDEGYKYNVTLEMKDFGNHYWRLRVELPKT